MALNEQSELDLLDSEEDEDTQKDKFITFILGKQEYAIEIQYVMEIVGLQKITTLPDMPKYIRGVINLRGQVYPIIDVRTRFRMDVIDYTDRTCIIIVNLKDSTIGLIVDEVSEVRDIKEDQIDPPPKTGGQNRFLKGTGKIGDEVKIILDVENIMADEDLEKINSAI